MNHCVPDFEMEDDYSIPPSSRLNRSKKPSMPEDEIMELLWQNGQVVVQSQNQRSLKKPSPFKFHDTDQPASREIRSSSYHQQQQQQSVTDHLFMQEDEMASWLHYPLSDANFDHDFCADLLYPSSSIAVAPCATSTAPSPPPLGRVPQVLVSASALATAHRPPIPPVRRNELESTRIQNFVNFSKHRTAKADQSGASKSKSVARESTVVDSCDTPAMAPESGDSQAMPSGTEAASGGDNSNAYANMSVAAAVNTQSAGVSLGASKDNLATCEVTVTSSPGASSASAEPTARKPVQAEDRKRKGREPDDAECQSEDVEFDPADRKKQSRGSTSTKRSRAAEVHNLSERRRRDRINEKMRALQELFPRCNKSDKASMLDEAIEYLKSLQLQVQMMSMGCGMVPMMFPGVQQYMPTMGMGMGMGIGMGMVMDMGISRPMMPFHNVLAGSGLPTPPSTAHLDPRFPVPAFHMSPQVPAPDPSRLQPNSQSDAMLNPLGMQNPNQPRIPNFADPYQQCIGLHQMQLQPPQCLAMAQPSSSKPCTSKGPENLENHPSGDMAQ
ncbi:hypothetical protein V6N13_045158 [Hibiscus sabdariffa]|uniref:BHLH domain-containing protein n=1 Tax=Hibiscus sabdariffa TaxID=183260 RepID=A0ABR2RK65_9ROSI